MNHRLAGLIFDLDGTLTDTLPIAFGAFRIAVERYSERRFTDAELVSFFGPSEEGILRQIVPEHWEPCFEHYLTEYAALHAGRGRLYPGMEAALAALAARGVRLAIVTGKALRATAITLERVPIARYFDTIEAGSPEGGVKDLAIRKVLQRWRLEDSRVAYVGDAVNDMQAAKAAGVTGIGAAWGGTASADALKEAGADVAFATVDEFADWARRS